MSNGPNGLYFETEPAPNGLLYHVWQSTAYHYQAPGDAYIYQAQFGYHNAHIAYGNPPVASAATPNNSCLYEGIYSPSSAAWEGAWFEPNSAMAGQSPSYVYGGLYVNQPRMMCQFTYADNWTICGYNCQPTNQAGTGPSLTPGNEISIGMFSRANAAPSSTNPNVEDLAYSGSVDWQESDMGRPSFDPSTVPQSDPQWVGNVTRSLSPTATDGGLGVKTAELSTPNTSGGTTIARSDVSCYGNRDYRCPQRIAFDNSTPFYYAAQPLSYNTANMPEGVNTLGLAAVDVVGNASAGTSDNPDFTANQWTVKVDRTAPTVTLSGDLSIPDGQWVGGGVRRLTISAQDGDGSIPTSGVRHSEVKLDGQTVDTFDQPCDQGSCDLAHDIDLNTDSYSEGQHALDVTVTDGAGNSWHQTSQLMFDHNAPGLTVSGTLQDAQNTTLSQPNYQLSAAATDSGAGVSDVSIRVDGAPEAVYSQPCTTGACAGQQTFTFNTADYSSGDHTVDVVASDMGGNITTKSFTVTTPEFHAACGATPPPTSSLGGAPLTPELVAGMLNDPANHHTNILAPSGSTPLDGRTLQPGLSDNGPDAYAVTGTEAAGSVSKHAPGAATSAGDAVPVCLSPGTTTLLATDSALPIAGAAALYANTAPSVDTVVRPTAVGTETFEHIRDITSPQDFALNVGLAADEHLEMLPDGSVAIVTGEPDPSLPDSSPTPAAPTLDQRQQAVTDPATQLSTGSADLARAQSQTGYPVRAVLPAPWATDANGSVVPTSFTINGNTVTLHVAHQQVGTAYPVVADPQEVTGDAVNQVEADRADEATVSSSQQQSEDAQNVTDTPAVDQTDPPPNPGASDSATSPPSTASAPPPSDGTSDGAPSVTNDPEAGSFGLSDTYPAGGNESVHAYPASAGSGTPSSTTRIRRTKVGVSDSDAATFGSNFSNLGVHNARAVVPWDLMDRDPTQFARRRFQAWYDALPATGVEPEVVFERIDRQTKLPDVAAYKRRVRAFLRTYGAKVHVLGTWNEPNYVKRDPSGNIIYYDPLARPGGPRRAAQLWTVLNSLCHTEFHCTAVAGEYVGYPKGPYGLSYMRSSHRSYSGRRNTPNVWSFHDYRDVNDFEFNGARNASAPVVTAYMKQFSATPYMTAQRHHPVVWMTEGGPLYRRTCEGLSKNPNAYRDYCGNSDSGEATLGLARQRNGAAYMLNGMLAKANSANKANTATLSRIYLYTFQHSDWYYTNDARAPTGNPANHTGDCKRPSSGPPDQCPHDSTTLVGADDDPDYDPNNPDRSVRDTPRLSYCLVRARNTAGVLDQPGRVKKCP